MISCKRDWFNCSRCCLLVLLFIDFAKIDVSAFNSNAVDRITVRQPATRKNINIHRKKNENPISPLSKTSSVVLFASNGKNIWFNFVGDFFSSHKETDDDRSKDNALEDFVELLEEADVGQDLLDEVSMIQEADTAIVELPVMFAGETEESFDFERWELHRSPQRYSRLLLGVFSGVTMQRIFPTALVLVVWSAMVEFYNSVENLYGMPELELPLTPFELAAPVLGLLLVFRSNTAYERFNVGSDATWEITGRFRSVIRQLLSFSASPGRFSPEERAAAYDLVDACLVLHSWILCDYLRPSNTIQDTQKSSSKQNKILQKALVLSVVSYDDTMDLSSSSAPRRQRLQQTPSGLINTVTMGICSRMPSLDPQESVMLEEQFAQIISSLGTCEKLIRTPIPLGYTRYSVRFVMIWLTLLPLALVRSFSGSVTDTWWDGTHGPDLVVSMLFLSVAFLSIEDISVQLEEPFSVLPLDLHQKWLKRDYAQMKKTSSLVDGMATGLGQYQQQHQHQQQFSQELTQKETGKKISRFRKWTRHGNTINSN